MLCCKAISVCMHAVHPVNTFVWNAAPCLVFVCHFTNYLELRALAQPKPSSVNTLAPLLGGSMLVGCSKTWLVKAVPTNMSQRWLSTNTNYSNTNFHTMVLFRILICKAKIYALQSYRTNAENQILKPGFTSREIVILENDDPGGVFEFSPVSRGPWFINVRIKYPWYTSLILILQLYLYK